MKAEFNRMKAGTRFAVAGIASATIVVVLTMTVLVTPATAAKPAIPAKATDATQAEPIKYALNTEEPLITRGRYLIATSGCNDCHTGGYSERNGQVPEWDWLTGSSVGYQGPWGTSYAGNLRLLVQPMNEEQWLEFARAERLPPMPWFALRDMSDADLIAIYKFIRSLRPKGSHAPAAVPPGREVTTPFIIMTPRNPAGQTVSQNPPDHLRSSG